MKIKNTYYIGLITLILFCSFAPVILEDALIMDNGSFENAFGSPDLNNWFTTCNQLVSVADAPLNGGNFSARLESGNTQGCFPGYAYQILSGINDGDEITIGAWMKLDPVFTPSGSAGIYFGTIPATGGPISLQFGETSNEDIWECRIKSGIVQLNQNDVPVIVLDAGLTGGPAIGYSYFDLVTVERNINCGLSVEEGDICVENANAGVILTAPNGNCFRVKINNFGELQTEIVSCP